MQDAMAVFANQPLNDGALASRHGSFVNKTPVPFVEIERLLSGDRIMWIAVPCDQSELGQIPNDKGVSCGFH